MKYARCPNCNGRLGIPSKKQGLPITCPKCDTEFVAPDHLDNNPSQSGKNPASATPTPAKRSKPSMRALPMPSSIAPTAENGTASASKTELDLTPPDKMAAPVDLTPPSAGPDPMMPPTSKRAEAVKPAEAVPIAAPVNSHLDPPSSKPAPSQPAPTAKPTPATPVPLPTPSLIKPATVEKNVPADEPAAEPQPATAQPVKPKRSVATIIKTESVQPSLTKDGKLPTLQLNDDQEPQPKTEETKTNPVLLVTVVVASLLSSALMMLMLNANSSDQEDRIEKTREAIRVFYEVRPDEEIKPYQSDLRHAQLAHSRRDYRTEIRAYESVMSKFRDENFDQYTGLTGTKGSDLELEKYVSILLQDAKRNAKR